MFLLNRDQFYLSKYPTFATFKRGGAFEFHVGTTGISEVVSFARHSVWAPNLQTLNPSNFPETLNDGHPWLIDFYAPWQAASHLKLLKLIAYCYNKNVYLQVPTVPEANPRVSKSNDAKINSRYMSIISTVLHSLV